MAKTLGGLLMGTIFVVGIGAVSILYGKEILDALGKGIEDFKASVQREILYEVIQNYR